MLGAIAGDVIGCNHEFLGTKRTDFELLSPGSTFTDDSVLTIAVARVILDGLPYADTLRDFGVRYPGRGYGGMFHRWLEEPGMGPYNSWGNGSAMRVSPVGFAYGSIERVLDEARRSAEVTHDHPEGIRGAQATALAVFLAARGADKAEIKREVSRRTRIDLERSVDEIRPAYVFDVSCQGSVPESIRCFLESRDWEDAVRLAVSLGGDADTMACITGGIAEAHYGLPAAIGARVRALIPDEFLQVIDRFQAAYGRSGA